MRKIQNLWEERSQKYKSNVKGVLPKAFPDWLNNILHNWMYSQIKSSIKNGDTVLDLGCGYGRLAKEVLQDFRKTKVNGVDIAKTYVTLFNKNLAPRGKAVVADIKKLPFKSGSVDVVYMVTTLMYLTSKKDQQKAIAEIFRVLKLHGKFIFIERNPGGHSLMTLGGLITKLRGKKNKEIESVSFTKDQMGKLLSSQSFESKTTTGFPFGPLLTPSLYISYSGVKI